MARQAATIATDYYFVGPSGSAVFRGAYGRLDGVVEAGPRTHLALTDEVGSV